MMVKFKQKIISSALPAMASTTHLYCPLESRMPLKENGTVVFTVSVYEIQNVIGYHSVILGGSIECNFIGGHLVLTEVLPSKTVEK